MTPRVNSLVSVRPSTVRTNHQPLKPRTKYHLNQKFLRLAPKGCWLRLRDLVRNVDIRGSIGSGKTVFVFNTILRSSLAAGHSAVILVAKPGGAAKTIEIAEAVGCGKNVRVIREGGGWFIDPIEWQIESAKRRGVTLPLREVLDEMQMMIEMLHRGSVAKEADHFFGPSCDELLHEIMKALLLATGKCRMRDILRCARRVPDKAEAFSRPEEYPIVRYLEAIIAKIGRTGEVDAMIDYWEQLAALSEKTRSSIVVSLTVRIAPMLEEPIYSAFFKHPTNLTPEMIDREGLIVVVDYPIATYGGAGRCIGAAIKQMCQKWCLNRPQESEEERPLGIFQDEAACWLTDRLDPESAERGRSAKMYHVNTYQSYSTIVNGYGGGAVGEARAKALTSNFIVHILCGQTDAETRKMASAMVGSPLGQKRQITPDPKEETGWKVSYSEEFIPELPEDWMLGLATGQKGYAEAFVFKGGDKFKWNGKRRMLVRWHEPLKGKWNWLAPIFERHATARSWVCSVGWRRFLRITQREGLRRAFCKLRDFWTTSMKYPTVSDGEAGDK